MMRSEEEVCYQVRQILIRIFIAVT